MKVKDPVKMKILNRIAASKNGMAGIADFTDLGRSDSVRQALSRLVRQKRLIRIHSGVYALPGNIGLSGEPIHPRFDDALQEWARKNGVRIFPSGAVTANRLGLSNQVPMRRLYFTSGRRRTVTIDGIKTLLLPRSGIVFDTPGKTLPWIVQAVRFMGKEYIDAERLKTILRRLPAKEKAFIMKGKDIRPRWVRAFLQQVEFGGRNG